MVTSGVGATSFVNLDRACASSSVLLTISNALPESVIHNDAEEGGPARATEVSMMETIRGSATADGCPPPPVSCAISALRCPSPPRSRAGGGALCVAAACLMTCLLRNADYWALLWAAPAGAGVAVCLLCENGQFIPRRQPPFPVNTRQGGLCFMEHESPARHFLLYGGTGIPLPRRR